MVWDRCIIQWYNTTGIIWQLYIHTRSPNTPPNSCSVVTEPQVLVWSRMWPGPQPNANSMYSYSCGSSHMMKYNRLMVVIMRSGMASRYSVRLAFKRWFLKIVQATIMKHDPFDDMQESVHKNNMIICIECEQYLLMKLQTCQLAH